MNHHTPATLTYLLWEEGESWDIVMAPGYQGKVHNGVLGLASMSTWPKTTQYYNSTIDHPLHTSSEKTQQQPLSSLCDSKYSCEPKTWVEVGSGPTSAVKSWWVLILIILIPTSNTNAVCITIYSINQSIQSSQGQLHITQDTFLTKLLWQGRSSSVTLSLCQ